MHVVRQAGENRRRVLGVFFDVCGYPFDISRFGFFFCSLLRFLPNNTTIFCKNSLLTPPIHTRFGSS